MEVPFKGLIGELEIRNASSSDFCFQENLVIVVNNKNNEELLTPEFRCLPWIYAVYKSGMIADSRKTLVCYC